MHSKSLTLLPLAFLLLLVSHFSCTSVADKVSQNILDSFKQINNSLESANKRLRIANDLVFYMADIEKKEHNNPELVSKARAFNYVLRGTQDWLDSFKDSLSAQDPSGKSITKTQSLLLDSIVGNNTKEMLSRFADACIAAEISEGENPALDTALNNIHALVNDPSWQRRLFKGTSTTSAIVILSGWKASCQQAAHIVLKDIDDHF